MKINIMTGDKKTDDMIKELVSRIYLPDDGSLCVISEGLNQIADATHTIVLYKSDNYKLTRQHAVLEEQYKENYIYIKKPYLIEDFLNACYSLIHKCAYRNYSKKNVDIKIDFQTRNLKFKDKIIHLTATEFSLFNVLYNNAGAMVTRSCLIQNVWKTQKNTNILEVYIAYLRKKLSPVFGDGIITSIRNQGYILTL